MRRSILSISDVLVTNDPAYDPVREPAPPALIAIKFIGAPYTL